MRIDESEEALSEVEADASYEESSLIIDESYEVSSGEDDSSVENISVKDA